MSRKKNHRIALTDKFAIIAAHQWILGSFEKEGRHVIVIQWQPKNRFWGELTIS
jgi:hypothetical protein